MRENSFFVFLLSSTLILSSCHRGSHAPRPGTADAMLAEMQERESANYISPQDKEFQETFARLQKPCLQDKSKELITSNRCLALEAIASLPKSLDGREKSPMLRTVLELTEQGDSLPPSLEGVQKLHGHIIPGLERALKEAPRPLRLIQAFQQKNVNTITLLVQERLRGLQILPNTRTNLKERQVWLQDFQNDFGMYADIFEPVSTVLATYEKDRTALLLQELQAGTQFQEKTHFKETLHQLPVEDATLNKAAKIFQEIFPHPEYQELPIYYQYEKVLEDYYQETVPLLVEAQLQTLRGFPLTLHGARDVNRWVEKFPYRRYPRVPAVHTAIKEAASKKKEILQAAKTEFFEQVRTTVPNETTINQLLNQLRGLFPEFVKNGEQRELFEEYRQAVVAKSEVLWYQILTEVQGIPFEKFQHTLEGFWSTTFDPDPWDVGSPLADIIVILEQQDTNGQSVLIGKIVRHGQRDSSPADIGEPIWSEGNFDFNTRTFNFKDKELRKLTGDGKSCYSNSFFWDRSAQLSPDGSRFSYRYCQKPGFQQVLGNRTSCNLYCKADDFLTEIYFRVSPPRNPEMVDRTLRENKSIP
ncbi:MAG: hypothetical protein KC643_21725 [Nitrospira sp.]|nr:hypothetical protein [Nitrospira sp.]MCB9776821.1 hypothetical protein [Nitrospiraceae bacterium]